MNDDKISVSSSYNYGIEILRIVSMLMIVTLHVLGHGGVLNSTVPSSTQWHVTWFLEIVCYCAVNCYALITGYVMINARFRYGKFLLLWLQVFFYSVGLTLVFWIVDPESIDAAIVQRGLIPVLGKQWWYFTAYAGLYFFIPFINRMIENLKKKELFLLCMTIVITFSILPTFVSQCYGDVFYLGAGYSTLWLIALYILGAAVKKFEEEIKRIRKAALVGWICVILITVLMHNLTIYLPDRFVGREYLQSLLVTYTSPTILGAALCMLIVFSGLKIVAGKWQKIIKWFSGLSFGVYLIHEHPLVRQNMMSGRFTMLATISNWKMLLCIGTAVIGIFMVCIGIEAIRNKLFEIMGVKEKVFAIIYRK